MKGLGLSELRRATSRRLVRFAALGAILGIVVGSILTARQSEPLGDAELARASHQYESSLQQCLARGAQGSELPKGTTVADFCSEEIRPEYFYPAGHFALLQLPDILSGTSILLILGAILIGASLAGADWHAGTMTTLLTWEPRRLRVLAARTMTAIAVVLVLAVALLGTLALALSLVAATRGITAGVDGAWVRSVVGVTFRTAVGAAIACAIGLGIAMLGRSTAAALGVAFAYLGVLEGLMRAYRPEWQPWLLGDNIAIFVSGHPQFLGKEGQEILRTVAGALVVAIAYAVVLLVAAGASLRARDVT